MSSKHSENPFPSHTCKPGQEKGEIHYESVKNLVHNLISLCFKTNILNAPETMLVLSCSYTNTDTNTDAEHDNVTLIII